MFITSNDLPKAEKWWHRNPLHLSFTFSQLVNAVYLQNSSDTVSITNFISKSFRECSFEIENQKFSIELDSFCSPKSITVTYSKNPWIESTKAVFYVLPIKSDFRSYKYYKNADLQIGEYFLTTSKYKIILNLHSNYSASIVFKDNSRIDIKILLGNKFPYELFKKEHFNILIDSLTSNFCNPCAADKYDLKSNSTEILESLKKCQISNNIHISIDHYKYVNSIFKRIDSFTTN